MIDLNDINKKEVKVITLKEFEKLNKELDLCFNIDSTRCTDEAEEYIIHVCEHVNNSLEKPIDRERYVQYELEKAEKIEVYKKKKFTLDSCFILESIESYLEDAFGYDSYECDSLENRVGHEVFDEACRKFNKVFRDSFYVTGELQDFYLNLRPELEKELKESEI